MKTLILEDNDGTRNIRDDLARPVDLLWLLSYETDDQRVRLETTKEGFLEVKLHPDQSVVQWTMVRLTVVEFAIPLFGGELYYVNQERAAFNDIRISRFIKRHQPLIGGMPLIEITYWKSPTLMGRWRKIIKPYIARRLSSRH